MIDTCVFKLTKIYLICYCLCLVCNIVVECTRCYVCTSTSNTYQGCFPSEFQTLNASERDKFVVDCAKESAENFYCFSNYVKIAHVSWMWSSPKHLDKTSGHHLNSRVLNDSEYFIERGCQKVFRDGSKYKQGCIIGFEMKACFCYGNLCNGEGDILTEETPSTEDTLSSVVTSGQ